MPPGTWPRSAGRSRRRRARRRPTGRRERECHGRDPDLVEGTPRTTLVTRSWYDTTTNDLLVRSESDSNTATKLVTKYEYGSHGELTKVIANCTSSGITPPADASTCTGGGTQDASTNLRSDFLYDPATGLLTLEWDALGRATKHEYDPLGNETAVVRNYTCSGTTLPTRGQTCTGTGTVDAQTNVRASSTFAGTIPTALGLATTQTDPVGNATTYAYDNLGRRTTEILPGDTTSIPALTRTNGYDELGNVTSETESWPAIAPYVPAGSRTTAHVYDLVGRETTLTPPAGPATTRTFDAAGNETQTVVGNVTTTRVFDGLGRATSETVGTAPDAVVTTRTYDGQGRELTATTAGSTTKEVYDLAGRLTTVIEDFGGLDLTTAHGYDPLGREVKIIDPAGTASRTGYDRLGRACRTVEASTQGDAAWAALANVCTSALPDPSTATTHDAAGNAVAVLGTDARMSAALVDPLDRVITSITNCTNSGTTVPAIGTMCAGSGTQNATTNITSRTWYDAAGTIVATQDPADTADRTIVNVRGLVKETIANCTDDGTTPPSTASPPACVGTRRPGGDEHPLDDDVRRPGTRSSPSSPSAPATPRPPRPPTTGPAASRPSRIRWARSPAASTTRPSASSPRTSELHHLGDHDPGRLGELHRRGHEGRDLEPHHDVATMPPGTSRVVAPNGRETRTSYDAGGRVETRTDNYVDGVPGATDDLVTTSFYDDAGRTAALRAPTANGTTFAVTRYLYDADGRLATEIRNCTTPARRRPRTPAPAPGRGRRTGSPTWSRRTATMPGATGPGSPRPLPRPPPTRRDRHHPLRLRRRQPALPGGGKLDPDRCPVGRPRRPLQHRDQRHHDDERLHPVHVRWRRQPRHDDRRQREHHDVRLRRVRPPASVPTPSGGP